MALIYFRSQIQSKLEQAYVDGFTDGVKFQKRRGPKPREIEIKHVD